MGAKNRRRVQLAPEIDALLGADDDKLYLQELAREILGGRVVLFAGAGLSLNAKCCDGGKSRIPAWWALAKHLRAQLGAKIKDEHDVLKIADYFEAKYGRPRLLDAVLTALRDDDHLPGRAHELVVELNFREILTTNFDTLLERAFRQLHIAPQVVIRDSDLTRRRRHPRILKVNGCATSPATIVLTGNDFLAYPRQHPLIEAFVTKCFVESTVLFVGFSLDDPAFRILNEKVNRALGSQCRQAYSLQFGISEEQRKHWFMRKVQLIDLAPCEKAPGEQDLDCEGILFDTLAALIKVKRRMSPLRQLSRRPPNPPRSALWELVESFCDFNIRQEALKQFSDKQQGLWSFDALAVDDMKERRRVLTFASLFAPLPALVKLVDHWLAHGEARLVKKELYPFSPTPEEYRIPLLGFCGVLEGSPQLFLQAADSLWARQLEAAEQDLAGREEEGKDSEKGIDQECCSRGEEHDDKTGEKALGSSHDALDVAYRFRYLIAAGEQFLKAEEPLSEWRGAELQLERLEKMLSQLFLADQKPPRNSATATQAILDELLKGWIFGSPTAPESLEVAWNLAGRDTAEGNSNTVPWELLIILTLTIKGELTGFHLDLLHKAWYREELDLTFLAEYVTRRISSDIDSLWNVTMPGVPTRGEDNHQERYEQGLARFIGWLCKLAAGEEPVSQGRQCLVNKLGRPVQGWMAARRHPPGLREEILRAWGRLSGLAPGTFELGEWAKSGLAQGSKGLSELSLFLPDEGEVVKPPLLDRLFREIQEKNDAVDFKVRRWFLDRCDRWPLSKNTLETLGNLLSGWLFHEAQSGSFGWLSLAADVQRFPKLRQRVEVVLKGEDANHPETLFLFVKSRLLPALKKVREKLAKEKKAALRKMRKLAKEERAAGSQNKQNENSMKGEDVAALQSEDYEAKVSSYHRYFIPFAEVMDEEFLAEVIGDLDPGRSFTREGTTRLLAALLQYAPEALRKQRGEAWQEGLERLIEAGASGEGALGPLTVQLSPVAVEKLQDNLSTMAVQRERRGDHRPVEWIVATLATAPTALPALEEALMELIASPSQAVAEASLAGILERQGLAFVERHRRRLRWIRAVVVARGGYRHTSIFAARLEELGKHLEQA